MARRLLLISTSTVFGTRYLEHAFPELREVLNGVRRVLFVPFALQDHAGYAVKARAAFEGLGFSLDSLHESGTGNPQLNSSPGFRRHLVRRAGGAQDDSRW